MYICNVHVCEIVHYTCNNIPTLIFVTGIIACVFDYMYFCITVSEEDCVPGYWSLPWTVSVVPLHRTIHGLQAHGKVLPRKVR